jgi:hypothetical protein
VNRDRSDGGRLENQRRDAGAKPLILRMADAEAKNVGDEIFQSCRTQKSKGNFDYITKQVLTIRISTNEVNAGSLHFADYCGPYHGAAHNRFASRTRIFPTLHNVSAACLDRCVRACQGSPRFHSSLKFSEDLSLTTKKSSADHMVREFQYRGETFRVNAHGIAGHEEVFIIYLVDGEEEAETSIDRMTEENDKSAPLEDICVMLCDRLIGEQGIVCAAPESGFTWVEGKILAEVHNGIQDRH